MPAPLSPFKRFLVESPDDVTAFVEQAIRDRLDYLHGSPVDDWDSADERQAAIERAENAYRHLYYR